MGRIKKKFTNEELVTMAQDLLDKYNSGKQPNAELMCEDFVTFVEDVIKSLSI